jgi:UvrD-like helicase C-terminal domain/ATP-dependent RecD-like DNA helicase SH3 domain
MDLLPRRDKVMQIENDYDKDVYNGDLGILSRIDMEEAELTIDFDGREVAYGFGELDQVVLAYATTIHKSQGSEYPAVVIPLTTQHYPMLQRNLIYTGVTRGKRLVVLIGQRRALAIAVKGARTRRRWSKLREWLEEAGICEEPVREGLTWMRLLVAISGRAFSWRGSTLASRRLKEAVSEINAVAKSNPVLAGEGVVSLTERLRPAFEEIDISSGALGNAVNCALEELIPVLISAPAREGFCRHGAKIRGRARAGRSRTPARGQWL